MLSRLFFVCLVPFSVVAMSLVAMSLLFATPTSAQAPPEQFALRTPDGSFTLEDPMTRRRFRRRVAGGVTLGVVVGAGVTAGLVAGALSLDRVSLGAAIPLFFIGPALTMTLAMSTGALLGRTVHSLKYARALGAAALGVLAGGIVLSPFFITISVDGGGAILLAGTSVAALAMMITTTLFTVRFARRAEQARMSVRAGLGYVSVAAEF